MGRAEAFLTSCEQLVQQFFTRMEYSPIGDAYHIFHFESVLDYPISDKRANKAIWTCYVTAKNTSAWLKMVLLLLT